MKIPYKAGDGPKNYNRNFREKPANTRWCSQLSRMLIPPKCRRCRGVTIRTPSSRTDGNSSSAGRELANGFSELNDADQANASGTGRAKDAGDEEAMYYEPTMCVRWNTACRPRWDLGWASTGWSCCIRIRLDSRCFAVPHMRPEF